MLLLSRWVPILESFAHDDKVVRCSPAALSYFPRLMCDFLFTQPINQRLSVLIALRASRLLERKVDAACDEETRLLFRLWLVATQRLTDGVWLFFVFVLILV